MPDRPPPDKVEHHLAVLAAAGQHLARLPAAAELRRRGRRRRRTRAAGAVLGVVLLTALVFQGRELLDSDQPTVVPINPAPSVSTVPAPTSTQSTPTTTKPSSTTTTSPSTATTPPSTTAATSPVGVVRLSVTPSTITPGQSVTFAGSGCPPGARVFIDLQGPLWATTADADGSYRTTFQVPGGTNPGPMRIQAACGNRRSATTTLTVR